MGKQVSNLSYLNLQLVPMYYFSFNQEMFNSFDWFIRLDDDAYVNFEKLHSFLNRVNSSQPLQIGHPGFGKNSQDFLKSGENYCMVCL